MKMKKLSLIGAMVVASSAALAGQEPYVAVVGDDTGANIAANAEANGRLGIRPGSLFGFYLEPKLAQPGFTHPDTFFPDESFTADNWMIPRGRINTEVCDNKFDGDAPPVNRNVRAAARTSADWFEWDIVLPKDPIGSINLLLQCGLVKPNEVYVVAPNPSDNCAGEAGEKVRPSCTRHIPKDGRYIKSNALPTLTVTAHPGKFNSFTSFNLTAIKNPSRYTLPRIQTESNAGNTNSVQVLDGSSRARVTLKACMPKTILLKRPVQGFRNRLGQTEAPLMAGDRIKVRMDVPSTSTVDIYCNAYSAKLMGIGDPISLLTSDADVPNPPPVATPSTP